jgi:hypothetical protein
MCRFGNRPAFLALVVAGAALAGVAGLTSVAEARTFVSVGIGLPGPGWYGPPAYVYGPPAVVYAPPPAVYVAPPVVVAPAAVPGPAPAAVWYYCDNPQGYYPYVQTCGSAWRAVQPTQPPAK